MKSRDGAPAVDRPAIERLREPFITPPLEIGVPVRAISPKPEQAESSAAPLIVGWREWAVLSLAEDVPVRAKIDTGAASSSLHASNIVQASDPFGRQIASFDLHLDDDRSVKTRIQWHPVIGSRMVLSSSGHWSSRPVIELGLRLGNTVFDTEVTLASRDEMEYRLLIGRAALRKRFCVDPSRSFVLGPPTGIIST